MVLLLKQNSLHTAAATQNASVCSGMRKDMRLPKAFYTNNPPILTAAPGEAGNETMLGRVVEAYNVKTRQQSTPTEPGLKGLLPDIATPEPGTAL